MLETKDEMPKKPSLDIVKEELLELRRIQSSSIVSIDTKVSILISLIGAALFISIERLNLKNFWPMGYSFVYLLSLLLAFFFLIVSYWVKGYRFDPSPKTLLNDYMFRNPDNWKDGKAGSKEQIIADQVEAYNCNEKILEEKCLKIKIAIVFLSLSILFFILQSTV